MKVSIITINRNNAEGLRKTIDSVTIQNYNDFEYIIVDGASTDNSLNVINNSFTFSNEKELILSNEFPIKGFGEINGNTVRWISESDTGVYHAMNRGILMLTG
jgi:glycosyltransferase involved in cell wall biosynthesis